MTQFTFRVEMSEGQPQRQIDADGFYDNEEWVVFSRDGEEYWRARRASVVSMETVRTRSTQEGDTRDGTE